MNDWNSKICVVFGDGKRFCDWKCVAVSNHHIFNRFVPIVRFCGFDFADHILRSQPMLVIGCDAHKSYHPFDDFAEDHMSAVEPRGLFASDEKLRTVGVFASVGHREPSGAVVLELEVFVCELFTIDAPTAGAIALGEVAS